MQIENNADLKPYNSFGIAATARQLGRFGTTGELEAILEQGAGAAEKLLVLGGGSNILLTGNVDGLVLRNEIMGKTVVNEDDDHIYLKAGAGENWHRLVEYCVERGYAGMENLSLIPGLVGASPMQNIGAYGVEIKDLFHELEAIHIKERTRRVFSLEDCGFGYRESVFKRQYKGQFIITSVTFRLNKKPVFNTSYGAINEELERMGVQELSIKAISQAVINIRTAKLPDPRQIGNAGSFFKNPQISSKQFAGLKAAYPAIPSFTVDESLVKIPAGWLIEQCGWKGYRRGDAGCYPKQALVLVNYGQATGQEIYALSEEIIASVLQRFGIQLEREVNII
ncbi:MAG TPA: UDP-N-acetylmuramate dehydrogenase [Flavisolibacter sp.]|nr:UDP-N-acetylmuramate dehydrogenase [Flavisolibacter sp.]